MNKFSGFIGVVFAVTGLLVTACSRDSQAADIPDIQSIYSNISYLDSLIRTNRVDSIGKVNDLIVATIRNYDRRAQSPDEAAILDSLISINSAAHDLIQFCSETQSNLDLLEQDTKALENQYRSGKIKLIAYASTLVEADQTLVDIHNQLSEKTRKALEYLKNQSLLVSMLSPIPMPADQ